MQLFDCNPRVPGLKHTGRALNGWSVPRKSLNFQFQSSPLSCLRWSAATRGEACKKEARHSAEQQHKLRRSVKRQRAYQYHIRPSATQSQPFCSCGARLELVRVSVNPSADRRHARHLIAPKLRATHPDGRRRGYTARNAGGIDGDVASSLNQRPWSQGAGRLD